VETNQFKHLTHLALRFLPASDTTLKRYLAARLQQFRALSEATAARLGAAEEDLGRTRGRGHEAEEALAQLREEYARSESTLRAETVSGVSDEKERAMATIQDMASEHKAEVAALQEGAGRAARDHGAAVGELKEQVESLTERFLTVQASEGSLRRELGQSTARLERCDAEIAELREANSGLDRVKFEQEKNIGQHRVEHAGLRQQVDDKNEILSQMEARVQEANSEKGSLQETITMMRGANARLQSKFETTVKEIEKGNSIIQRLQAEHKQTRQKLKLKTTVVQRQEKIITERNASSAELSRRTEQMSMELQGSSQTQHMLAAQLEESKRKLVESARLVESNQQVIAWLNKEINDLQMGGGRGMGGGMHTSPGRMTHSSGADISMGSLSATMPSHSHTSLSHASHASHASPSAVQQQAVSMSRSTPFSFHPSTAGGLATDPYTASASSAVGAAGDDDLGGLGRTPLQDRYEWDDAAADRAGFGSSTSVGHAVLSSS
jgi:spindle assembly abnormal protein 6